MFSQIPIFIDQTGFTYYRVTASITWAKKSGVKPCLDNELFTKSLKGQYFASLTRFKKQLEADFGLKFDLNDMYSIRDCPREQIWRRTYLPQYKAHRDQRDADVMVAKSLAESSPNGEEQKPEVGPMIKWIYDQVEKYFGKSIRVTSAEADDVIACMTKMALDTNGVSQVIILSGDSDFHQLLVNPRVAIYNPRTMIKVLVADPQSCLQDKITKGDASDGVPSLTSHLGSTLVGGDHYYGTSLNAQQVDFDYIPRNVQNNIINKFDFPEINIPHNYRVRPIQLGLCCINMELRDHNIFCSRKCILATIQKKGMTEVFTRCQKNALDLLKLIEWNSQNGIRVFRISSELFPHYANHRVPKFSLDQFQPILAQAGALARKYKQRLTFHPGHYNVVGCPDPETFQNTVRDLDYHAEVLDRMGCDQDSVMVVHGGGQYKNKPATIERWIKQFTYLPTRVQRRLVLENCEKNFNIEDCLYVSSQTGVPVVFDTHHYDCYKLIHPEVPLKPPECYIDAILASWTSSGIKPKFHVSEQGSGQIGNHSDYVQTIPQYLLEIPAKYGINIDIMIEAKHKEKSIQHLYNRYPFLNPQVPLIQVHSDLTTHQQIVPQNGPPCVITDYTKIRVQFQPQIGKFQLSSPRPCYETARGVGYDLDDEISEEEVIISALDDEISEVPLPLDDMISE